MFVSLDGTDFLIQEPTPFSPKWWSHKLNHAGLRYEVGICIRTGHIVWAYGGKPCGEWSDLTLARHAYIYAVEENEKTLADKGYMDREYFVNSRYYPESARTQKQIMARHESVNSRLKQFGVLRNAYRHSVESHPTCFMAVANIVQVSLEFETPLYSVNHLFWVIFCCLAIISRMLCNWSWRYLSSSTYITGNMRLTAWH